MFFGFEKLAKGDGLVFKGTVWAVTLFCVLALGFLDYASGYETSLEVFYVLPVAAAAWYLGPGSGILVSLLAAVVLFASNRLAGDSFSREFIPYWNAGTRLSLFIVVAYLSGRLRSTLDVQHALARTDSLTGASNELGFRNAATAEIARSIRYNHPLTLAYIDLDHFKEVNDQFGHERGGEVLRLIGREMLAHVRESDIVARIGGDEFVILFPETGGNAAAGILNRLRGELLAKLRGMNLSVTLSIGALACERPPDDLQEIIRRADRLMYDVKESGRDGIKLAAYP